MPTTSTAWFVYMLECRGEKIYTGITPDVALRFEKHCAGKGAAFTRINPPLRLLAKRRCRDRSAASILEAQLKKLPRPGKLVWAARHKIRP